MRPRTAAGCVALGACAYAACLFGWEIKWGHDLMRRAAPLGTMFQLQWAAACAALVAAAAAAAWVAPRRLRDAAAAKVPRAARVGGGASRALLALLGLALVRVVSLHVVAVVPGRAGMPDRAALREGSRAAARLDLLKWNAYQLGWDAMVPMALLGIPTAQFSPPLRALGLPHEAAIALHRVLGRATVGLVAAHGSLYALTWGLEHGWTYAWDEALAVCHRGPRRKQNRAKAKRGSKLVTPHGRRVSPETLRRAFSRSCLGISNFFGLCALVAGLLLGAASVHAVRRKSYDAFLAAHQLHVAWWVLACCHWPGMLSFVAPALVFFVADVARRRACERRATCTAEAGGSVATLRVPLPGHAASDLVGGAVRLRRAGGWAWHPFTIAGAAGGPRGVAALIHVFADGPWTRALVAAAAGGAVDLDVRGPLLAPAALFRRAEDAARGRPALVVAAGSGLAPAAAFLRAVRAARPGKAARVRLVAVVRSADQLECLPRFCRPDADGATGEPWLSAEAHVTRGGAAPRAAVPRAPPPAAEATANPLFDAGDVEEADAAWPEVAAAAAPPPAAPGPAGADDAAALVAAGAGFLAAAYAVAWRDDAPFAAHGPTLFNSGARGNPNVVAGGFSLAACAAAAYAAAAAALYVAARARRRRRGAYDAVDVELRDGGGAAAAVAGVGRPDLAAVVARADAALGARADVLAGGPQPLLDGLEDALAGRPVDRLTWAM